MNAIGWGWLAFQVRVGVGGRIRVNLKVVCGYHNAESSHDIGLELSVTAGVGVWVCACVGAWSGGWMDGWLSGWRRGQVQGAGLGFSWCILRMSISGITF